MITEEEGQQEGWDGMIGPINASKPVALATGLVPVAAREEVAEAWLGMNDFLEYQWAGGLTLNPNANPNPEPNPKSSPKPTASPSPSPNP